MRTTPGRATSCIEELQMDNNQPTRLIPVTDWNKHHPWPPLGGLRHLIFNAASNGFNAVIRRVGRRVLIDERAFFEWTKSGGGQHVGR